MKRRLAVLSALGWLLLGAGAMPAQAPRPTAAKDDPGWKQDLATWRAQREKEMTAPDSWLTLAGLEWLKPGINSFGTAADNQLRILAHGPEHIGMLTVSGNIVQLLAPRGGFPPELTVDGKPAREGTLTVEGAKPSTIEWHGLSMVVLKRGDRFMLRIKDADSPARVLYKGLNWFAPDAKYRVTARWVPYKPAQVEHIPTVIGTTLDMTAPGAAEFLLNGKVMLLEPVFEGDDTSKLFFILRDETSNATTYGGGRFLTTGLPDHGVEQPGSLVLDFNRLYNPPCAYTPYATCPLPPEKNHLPIAIEAGEKRYTE